MTTPQTMFAGVHASSVGTGIANAIFAVASTIDGPEGWVHLCITAAEEAYDSVISDPPLVTNKSKAELQVEEWLLKPGEPPPAPRTLTGEALELAARTAARAAFRCCMPQLVNRRSIQAFIACVATGQLRGYLTGSEANALVYTAQNALTAFPKRRASRARK